MADRDRISEDLEPGLRPEKNVKEEAKPSTPCDEGSSPESSSRGSSSHGSSFHGSSSQGASFPKLVPIAALVPGIKNWEIRGHVLCKSDVERYNHDNGSGKYFSFEMKDKPGCEIRVVCFNGQVDRFFDKVIQGKEYVLSKGKLIEPKPRYNTENRGCEIVLECNAVIRSVEGEENNKTLLERVAELEKSVEFCISKLQELEAEIKRGKMNNAGASCKIL